MKHASCYKAFVRIQYTTGNTREDEGSNDYDHDLQPAYDAVYSFCEDLIANPRVIEFKEIRELLSDEADKLGISVPDSHSKNLMRKMSNMFEELQFVSYQHNKVLVYPITLEMQNAIIENFELNSELKLTSSKSDNEDNVIQVAKLLTGAIKNQQPHMSWPPTKDLKADKIGSYIPHLLDIFSTVLISGQSLESTKSKAEKTSRLKDSFAQGIVFFPLRMELLKHLKVFCSPLL